jgi:glycosyltransferase involved in cell wall biosynthesis
MKVLHVIPSLSSLRGGPTFVVKSLASYQARAGVEVHVATTDDDDRGRQNVPLGAPVSGDGATYWYFARNTRTYQSSLGLTSWLLRHTADFDLVHIHSLFTFPATAAATIAHRVSVPYVVRPLGVLNRWGLQNGRAWAKRLSMRLIENGILRRAAAVQFSSVTERAETAEVCHLWKTAVIGNPVDLDPPVQRGFFRARNPSIGDRQMVLFLARLDPVKGIELLLSAFQILRQANPQVVLAIAGSGDRLYEQTLRARAEELGIAADVIWTGFLDRSAKAQALADADVFVVPSISESFGLAAVEALAAGVPTVMTDGVGIADEVASSGAGIVVTPDSRALASAMERILSDDGLAASLSRRGVSLVQSRYRPDAVAAEVMKLYAEIGGLENL